MSSPSTALTSSAAAASSSSSSNACAGQSFSDFPTKDTACAVGSTSGIPSNYSDVLKNCCKDAPVESWASDCALYCLSVDQSVADLQKCYMDGGVKPGDIFCNGNNTATATGKPSGSGSGAKETGQSGSASGSAAGSTSTPGAAYAVGPQGVSKAGLGMLAVLLGSAVFGALL